MPKRDTIHELTRQALVKDGWEITDDPYVISFGKRFLFVDFGAVERNPTPSRGILIGAQRQNRQIAVEVKEFRGKSGIADLEQAIGQYVLYRLLLQRVDPTRKVYLAVTNLVYDQLFSEPIGEVVISDLPLQLVVIDIENVEVIQWIPAQTIGTS